MTKVVRIGDGVYRVEMSGRAEVVYVAGPPTNRWAYWNGHIFRGSRTERTVTARSRSKREAHQALSAPMPATVLKVLIAAGTQVKKGETLVILEAMKMELPLRAPADATVTAVHCREGELVQPDTVLVELA
jgi:3-methylcrotonyl-CoA carboxylase alpha subunit